MRWNEDMGWAHCVGISISPNDGLRSVVDDQIQKAENILIYTNVKIILEGISSQLHIRGQSISNGLTEGRK